ncbi:CinA family protein [Labrys monachus]|uniref:Nicotinamide-nucleotide amidase n=1 Tax=Labrys monachus TaxID=217067 RepID=A0ABU0FGX2_9HYPH|nr:CinA family protein [Labrys monachus]MDQ0393850.1 nicotinamide-nucleotide amidase [Labrys monachus]
MNDDIFFRQAEAVLAACRGKGLTVATAESCTGGLVAGALTAVPGSSDVVDRGFVTYSNEAKIEMLGVPRALIERDGAVSESVAFAMAEGAVGHSRAGLSVAITGVAGPGGGTAAKPVGLVHFAAWSRRGPRLHVERRFGELTRSEIRKRSVEQALDLLLQLAGEITVLA